MAECFCGCGREIRGPGFRGMNKNGRRTVGLLAKLRELQQRMGITTADEQLASETLGVPVEELREAAKTKAEIVQRLIDVGEEYRETWMGLVHDEAIPSPPREARAFKQGWEVWGREGMALCRASGIPISRLGAFRGRL